MKKILPLVFVAVLFFQSLSAQDTTTANYFHKYHQKHFHFGFSLGMNVMSFTLKPVDNLVDIVWTKDQAPNLMHADNYKVLSVTTTAGPGFSIGFVASYNFCNHFELKFIPSLVFGSRSIKYQVEAISLAGTPAGSDTVFWVNKKINSTYAYLPLLIKYTPWQRNNFGGYFIAGSSYSIDLAAVKKAKNNTGEGHIILNPHDIGAEVGAGVEFYKSYYRLSIEAKMVLGLRNLVVDDNTLYSGSINQLHSRIFMLTFTFE